MLEMRYIYILPLRNWTPKDHPDDGFGDLLPSYSTNPLGRELVFVTKMELAFRGSPKYPTLKP